MGGLRPKGWGETLVKEVGKADTHDSTINVTSRLVEFYDDQSTAKPVDN